MGDEDDCEGLVALGLFCRVNGDLLPRFGALRILASILFVFLRIRLAVRIISSASCILRRDVNLLEGRLNTLGREESVEQVVDDGRGAEACEEGQIINSGSCKRDTATSC